MITQHLKQAQLAERWNISPRTLERWRWLGQGPRFLKIGGRVVYRLEDIVAFETERSRASTSFNEDGSSSAYCH
ncbi:MAG: helix-turn-helix domain-containing protein [Rhodospirillaceae bacterium]